MDYAFWGNLNKIEFHAFRVQEILYPLGQNDVTMTSLSGRIFFNTSKVESTHPKEGLCQISSILSQNIFLSSWTK